MTAPHLKVTPQHLARKAVVFYGNLRPPNRFKRISKVSACNTGFETKRGRWVFETSR
jgi:hypothetical protein